MSPRRTLAWTFWAMIFVQTLGSVDVKGPRKMPSPKQYVAIVVLWSILNTAAESRFARAASQLSVLVVLTAMVAGPFGQRFLSFLRLVGSSFTLAPAASTPGGGASLVPAPPSTTTPGGMTA